MNFRKIIFKIQDYFKVFKVGSHYNQLVEFYNNNNSHDKELSDLLTHAVNSVPYYKKISSKNLEDFPVINKTKIKSELAEFRSKSYLNQKVLKMTTSGSTGTPFSVYQDFNKKARNHADTIYFGKLAGYDIGNKLFYLKIWAKEKMSNLLVYKFQNIVPVDVISLSEFQIKEIIDEIESHSNKKHNILGYVSALEQIIRYCEKNRIKQIEGNVLGVITMSEGLSDETRQKLKSLFNSNVVSRFSNIENGIIAQQLFDENHFIVNTASYHVEVLSQDSDEILPNGSLGRIVVTDLFNYAMPMIRYDTGDLGILEEKESKTYFKRIEGRKLDVLFDTKGQVVSSYIMYKNMWQYNEIEQYQLIQTAEKSYVFKINCYNKFTREDKLVAEFKTYLGNDADFKVEYVEEIPLLSSGKRRKTVNLYKKTI